MKLINRALLLLNITTCCVGAMEETPSQLINASGKRLRETSLKPTENRDNDDAPPPHKHQRTTGKFEKSQSSCAQIRTLFLSEHKELPIRTDQLGNTLLHIAAKEGNLEAVKLLCENAPAFIEKTNNSKETALHVAAFKGQHEIVQYLCEKHPELLNKVNHWGNTIVYLAASQGHFEMVKYLCENYPELLKKVNNQNKTALHIAAHQGHLEIVQYFCKEHSQLLTEVDCNGDTALHAAAFTGRLNVVRYLCENHSQLLEQDSSNGDTALHVAAFKGRLNVVRYLCENHSQLLSKVDNEGDTALHAAAADGQLAVVQYLCEKRSQLLTQLNNERYLPLQVAITQGQLEVVRYFCIHYPQTIAILSLDELHYEPTLPPATVSSINEFLKKMKSIYFFGLIPDSQMSNSTLHLDHFNQIDLPLMAEILQYQPLNYQGGHKIIAAVKAAVDEANSKFEERMHKEYYAYMLRLLKNDASHLLKGSQEELRAVFENEKQQERAAHGQKISHGTELIKLFQKYRMPNLRSLVLHSLTPKLLNVGNYGQTPSKFTDDTDYFTVLFDLVKLAAEDHPLAWEDIVPGIRMNTENLKDYLQVIQSRHN